MAGLCDCSRALCAAWCGTSRRTGSTGRFTLRYNGPMDTILVRPWTTESFLAWEDRQEFKYEFDGQRVIPMTGGTIAHQRIVANIWLALLGVLEGQPLLAIQEMHLRIGRQIRYPDVM